MATRRAGEHLAVPRDQAGVRDAVDVEEDEVLGTGADRRRGAEVAGGRQGHPPVPQAGARPAEVPLGRGQPTRDVVRRRVVDRHHDVDVGAALLGAQPTDLAREVGVPPAHDRDDCQPRGRHADPGGRHEVAVAGRQCVEVACGVPGAVPGAPPGPALATALVRGLEDVRPAVRGRPFGAAVGDSQPAQGFCRRRLLAERATLRDDDGGRPCRGDVGDGVLPGVGDHDVCRAQLGPRGRVKGAPGCARSTSQPGVDLARGLDGRRRRRRAHRHPTAGAPGGRRSRRAPAAVAGRRSGTARPRPTPWPSTPAASPAACDSARPGGEQGVGEVVGGAVRAVRRAHRAAPRRRPECRTTGRAGPPPRTRRRRARPGARARSSRRAWPSGRSGPRAVAAPSAAPRAR